MAIADTQDDDFQGSVVLFDVADGSAEVGFWLVAEARGAGLASAAVELAQRFARLCGLESLRTRTVTDNTTSQRVLMRAGFAEVARTHEATPSGRHATLIHYEADL